MVRRTSVLQLAALASAAFAGAALAQDTPVNFKVAFFGDQGLGPDSVAVLPLALAEGADAIVHLGDFDYGDDPAAWQQQLDDVLPPCFPYFAVAGNHDESEFPAYQSVIQNQLLCAGVSWQGEAGKQFSFTYQGIYFVLTTPGMLGSGDADYVAERLASPAGQAAAWRISGWHLLMRNLQIGGKGDESGWPVYENSRLGGAIVATGHEHSYERTNLLSDMSEQVVAGTDLVISEGKTFAFVSGLGGESIRDQERCLPTAPPYGCNGTWASIYAEQQGANYGALFLEFNHEGDPCLARGYFKDVNGNVPDQFLVRTTLGPCHCTGDANGDSVTDEADAVVVFDNWGCQGLCAGDVNGDLIVDVRDHLMVLENWGDCGQAGRPLSAPGTDQHGNNPRAVAAIRDPFAFGNWLVRALAAPRRPEAAPTDDIDDKDGDITSRPRGKGVRGADKVRTPRRDGRAGGARGGPPKVKYTGRSPGNRRNAPAGPGRGAPRAPVPTLERGPGELQPRQ